MEIGHPKFQINGPFLLLWFDESYSSRWSWFLWKIYRESINNASLLVNAINERQFNILFSTYPLVSRKNLPLSAGLIRRGGKGEFLPGPKISQGSRIEISMEKRDNKGARIFFAPHPHNLHPGPRFSHNYHVGPGFFLKSPVYPSCKN